MSSGEITLVCEGEPGGRDVRWLGLALADLGVAKDVELHPAGSKSDLVPTIRAWRALGRSRVFGIRDRDFLEAARLEKDLDAGVYPLQRHCLETYLIEPELLQAVAGAHDIRSGIEQLADQRFWLDVGRAVLEDVAFSLRRNRPRFDAGDAMPMDRSEMEQRLASTLMQFPTAPQPHDVADVVDRFARDMEGPVRWTRVDGKELFKAVERDLGGDLERKLFVWCSENRAPAALVRDVQTALEKLGAWPIG